LGGDLHGWAISHDAATFGLIFVAE